LFCATRCGELTNLNEIPIRQPRLSVPGVISRRHGMFPVAWRPGAFSCVGKTVPRRRQWLVSVNGVSVVMPPGPAGTVASVFGQRQLGIVADAGEHPDTATAANIQDEEWVLLETPAGAVTVKAKLNASLDPAVVATQYGWWQECLPLPAPGYDPFSPAGANANLLIPDDEIDPISGSVPHRAQRCRVRKRADPAAAAR
jgi:hypothetical protein